MIDYTGAPRKPLLELLNTYDAKKMYLVLEDVLGSPESYEIIYQDILDMMKWGFEFEQVRTRSIRFKILRKDKKYYQMEMRHFLSNMILWYAFMETDTIEALKIFDFNEANTNAILDYMEDNILPICQSDFYLQNKIIDEIIYHMNCIASSFGVLFGAGISVYNIIKTEEQNPRIGEILYGDLDPSLQPNEIEEELAKRTKEMIQLFSEVDNDLRPLFKSGKNLSEGQFKELVVKIGLKADINGNTIPHLLNSNILVGGISTPADHYIEAVSGRKSLVLQKTKMGLPGSFSKKITTNTASVQLRQDHDMCDSRSYITYTIEDKDFLKLLNKRYYHDPNDGTLKVINYKTDKHLIGETLQFKSPCTCSSREGVCKICYGDLYSTNVDLYSAGAFSATKMANPLGQMVLSAKHLQLTHTTPVTFGNEFNDLFELNLNEISVKDQEANDDMDLYIQLGTIFTEEMEDDEQYYVKEFKVIDLANKYEFPISEENESNLYLTKELLALNKKYKEKDKNGPIPLEEFDDDSSVLFYVEVKNKELTKPFKDLETLLNSNDKFGCKTLSDIAQKMGRIIVDSGINIDFVHNEMIIRGLTRKASNEYEEPDFSPITGDPEDYKVLRLNDALFKSPSPTISLSYGYLRKQLLSVEFYQKRGISHLDPLFVPQLSSIIPEGK